MNVLVKTLAAVAASTVLTASRARRLIKNFASSCLTEPCVTDLEAAVGKALANSAQRGLATEIDICCSLQRWSLSSNCMTNGQGFDHPKSAEVQADSLSPARRRGYGFQIMRETVDEVTFSGRWPTPYVEKASVS